MILKSVTESRQRLNHTYRGDWKVEKGHFRIVWWWMTARIQILCSVFLLPARSEFGMLLDVNNPAPVLLQCQQIFADDSEA